MGNYKALYTPDEVAEIVYGGNLTASCIRVHCVQGKDGIKCTRFGSKLFISGEWVKEQLEFGLGTAEAAAAHIAKFNSKIQEINPA